MTYETLSSKLDDAGVLLVTLDRPGRLNAFTVQMADELVEVFESASLDDAVRAVVVTGAGKAFCAGMDLAAEGNVFGLDERLSPTLRDLDERLDDPEIVRGVRDTGGRVTLAIFDCMKPVIAAINGDAIGVGATMPLAMDIRIAAETARFGFVFGKIGIVPDACSSWFLPRVVGLPKALQWTYTGELVDARQALATGLASEVLPQEQVLERALAVARKLATERSGASIALTRQMLWHASGMSHPLEAHKIESLAIHHASMRDGKEGVQAFLQKRPAQFRENASSVAHARSWFDRDKA